LEGADRQKYRNACSGNIGGKTTIHFKPGTAAKIEKCEDIPRNPEPLGGVRQARQLVFTSP